MATDEPARVVFELAIIERARVDGDHVRGVVSAGIAKGTDPIEVAHLLNTVARAIIDGDLFIGTLAEQN